MITLAAFPTRREDRVDTAVVADMELMQGVVTTIRTARAERGVKPSARISAIIEGADLGQHRVLDGLGGYLRTLAGLDTFRFADHVASDPDTVTRVHNHLRVHIHMPHTDRAAEVEKLRKALEDATRELAGVEARLANESFVSRAPAEVVQGARDRQAALITQRDRITRTLRELGVDQ